MQTLRDMINDNAKRHPDKTALIFENRRYTFKRVYERVSRLINALAELGVEKGDRVGILAYNCHNTSRFLAWPRPGGCACRSTTGL